MKNEWLEPGDVVSVRFGGVLRHYGVVTYGGRIISNNGSAGGVISQTYEEFAKGRRVRIERHSGHDANLAHHRAQRRIGGDYHLSGSNCVHFMRHAQGRKPTSVQVARAVLTTFSDMMSKRPR